MPSLNVTYTPTNAITVTDAGTYKIDYFLNASVAIGTTLTMAVQSNGTNIPGATISRVLAVGTDSIYSGSIVVDLPAAAVITMVLSALLAVGVTLGTGTNAILTVTRLDA